MAEQPQAGGPASWRDLLERMLELGLGAALLTGEAATKLVDDIAKRTSMTREEGRRLVDDVMEKGKQQRQRLDEVVSEMVERVLARSDLARRSQVEALERRVALLEAQLRARPAPPWEGPEQGPTPV